MEASGNVDRKAIESILKRAAQAYAARDWDAFTSFFTPDAVWLPPGQPPLAGKDAWWSWIGERWQQSNVEELSSQSQEIVISGDWAYEWHTETQRGPGWQMHFKGVFIVQRQEDGTWKIALYCFNRAPEDG